MPPGQKVWRINQTLMAYRSDNIRIVKSLIILLLLLVLAKALLIYKVINALPLTELKRRARSGGLGRDHTIFQLASYGFSLSIFLWLAGGVSGGVLIVMLSQSGWWLGLGFILLLSWVVFSSRFDVRPGGLFWNIAGTSATLVVAVLSFLHTVISPMAKFAHRPKDHSKIFEKLDLIELLDKQVMQADNRIDERELKIAKAALSFFNTTVRQVMVPVKEIKWLDHKEAIGPKLMDELHKTGRRRFPVIKGSSKSDNPEIVGGLYINDLLNNLDKNGTVADLMVDGAFFIGESHTLYQALDAFLKTKQHLLIVVNNFEEITGLVSLEDVLKQIFGDQIDTDFTNYQNKHAVAGHDSLKDHQKTSEIGN